MELLFENLNYMHWLVIGLVLIIIELFVWSLFLLWIGASAITVSIIFYLIPEISGTLQLIIFLVLASSATYLSKRYYPVKTVDDQLNDKAKKYIGKECIIPPNSFALGTTIEVFKIPRDIMCIVVGKSTYARTGIIVNVTPIESEFFGTVTLEFSNTTPLPAKIYANEGVAQFLFLKGDQSPETSYADRKGKYMGQTGVTLPKV